MRETTAFSDGAGRLRVWHWLLALAMGLGPGCGTPPATPKSQAAPEEVAQANPDEGASDDEGFDLPDGVHEFSLPAGEADQNTEFLSATVKRTTPSHKLPFLATCRIEHGGRVTTGAIIHSSPRFGTYILSCRHGREHGGEWEARLSSGAMLFGKKYVVSKSSDLCLLVAKGQIDLGYVRPIPIRMDPLASAEPCLSIGYDHPLGRNEFSKDAGESARPWTEAEPRADRKSADGYPMITTFVPSGPGRSGGGLFIVRTSELIGVCSFKDVYGVHFVGRRSVLSFLNRCQELGHVPWWNVADLNVPNLEAPAKAETSEEKKPEENKPEEKAPSK